MDKILQISQMFGCDLDTLLQGSVCEKKRTDTAGYDRHMNRRTRMISVGVTLCILGVAGGAMLIWIGGEYCIGELSDGVGLAAVAVGVGILTYGGLDASKYQVEQSYNQAIQDEIQAEKKPENERTGRYCAVIMMAATIIFVLYLFLGNGNGRSDVGRVAAAVYITAGLLCGMVSVWLEKREK